MVIAALHRIETNSYRIMPKLGLEVGHFLVTILLLVICAAFVLTKTATTIEVFPMMTYALGLFAGKRITRRANVNSKRKTDSEDAS